MLTRKSFLIGTGAMAFALCSRGTVAQAPTGSLVTEEQRGDPEVNYETLAYSPENIKKIASGTARAQFEEKRKDFSGALLKTAKTYVGKSRATDAEEIADFLALYGLPFKGSDGQFVPYCAAGLSYAAALAYADLLGKRYSTTSQRDSVFRSILPDIEHHWFYPTPSVRDMYYVAEGKRRTVNISKEEKDKPVPKPGWLVIYNFGKGFDHVGIVESADKNTLHTIEFNTAIKVSGSQTNGGVIAEKTRPYDGTVRAFIKTT